MVKIQLDRERHLLRTFRGMKLFEEKTGKSMLRGFNAEECTSDDFVALLWSLLIHEDRDLTIEQVEELTSRIDALDIINGIAQALQG
ncbi:MAG: hypothetical protein PHQ43_13070 [Dehalococcoidales bacterium]|nr:hypothetical protein [Dehalococcoidales bacterium]